MRASIKFAFALLIVSLVRVPVTHAVDADIQFECLGIDGIPISSGTAQAISCCANGQLITNPPATCRAGFNSITASAAIGAAMSVNLAQKTLETARDLNGASVTYDSPSPSQLGNASDAGSELTTSAITARASDSGNSDSDSAKSGSVDGSRLNGSEAQDSLSGGSANASAFVLPQNSVNPSLGKNKSDSTAATSDASSSAFVKMENGVGSELKFGEPSASHVAVKTDPSKELEFSGGSASDSSEKKSGRVPSNEEGSSLDPSDYFSRIDRSASLFEVVSKRYLKVSARARSP